MRRSKRTEVPFKKSGQNFKDYNIGTELTSVWQSLAQSKAALRHIENRLEAGPGTGVFLESVMDPTKKKSLRKTRCTEGQQGGHTEVSSKKRGRSQQSPEKSSSRSPLRNSTQDNTVRNSVEFREPLASYREATPPPRPSSPPELYSLQSLPGSSYSSLPSNSNPVLGHLVYQRDTRDKQTYRDLDSTHSSALESMEVHYLNDQPALDSLRTNLSHATALNREGIQRGSAPKAQVAQSMDSKESTTGSTRRGESTPSSSPGSASQRLENLRRHQPDDKLEKLKERIRKQRQHLEEAVEREKTCNYSEKPVMGNGKGTSNMPIAKVRKVATAPPAPIYKGFNGTETKIRSPDGKIWKEEEFHNLSREMYKDLSRQFAESTKSHLQKEQRDLSKERRAHKPVRKVHKVGPASDLNAKPVISPASWREGQKLVKMVLGPVPRVTNEDSQSQTANKRSQKASPHRLSSDPRSESNRRVHPKSTAKKEDSKTHSAAKTFCVPSSAVQETAPLPVSTDMLSADIQGILEDLQLEGKTGENNERARPRSRRGSSGRRGRRGGSGSRTRAPVSVWETTAASRGCRSVSPTNQSKTANAIEAGQKKRHYDADTVRQYIAQQQEQRKRRQAEEKKVLREEAEKRNQRLQELYRKQREVAKTLATSGEVSVAPVQKRLQATFNKLLLEGAQLEQVATQMRPMYQPSGESDKENKRLEPPQSPSSSDRSLNYPPFSRNDLDYEASSTHLDRLIPAVQPMTGCSNEHLLSQLLRLETAIAASEKHTQRPATAPNHPQAKMSRIEALKATATSLSNRIESEARKLAGEGLNYGLTTAVDVDTIVAPRSSQTDCADSHWTEMAINPSVVMENEDMALRVERVLSGQHLYKNGLPGRDVVKTFKGQKEKNSMVNSHDNLSSYTLESEGLANGMEMNETTIDTMKQRKGYEATYKEDKCTNPHDNSSGSISEGPLSEGSLLDGDPSPFHPTNVFSPIGHQEAVQYSVRKGHQRLSEFQKEAERFSAFNSVQQETVKPAWEEFNKGSPLSVINIFTKNLHGNAKVGDRSLERNSPSAHFLPSGNCVGDVEVYENDFVSTHSSGISGQKKDFDTSSASSHFEELLRRSTERRGNNSHSSSVQSPRRSSGSTSGSSPHSKNSTKKRGKVSDQSDATLVEDHGSSCSPASEALSSESRKRGSQRSSIHSQATEVSGHSHQSSDMDKKMSPPCKLRQSSPGSLDHSSSLEANSFSVPFRSSSPKRTMDNTSPTAYPAVAEDRATGELQYSPAVLQQRLAAELHYLESIEESVRQLGDIERLMGVSMAQHESASMAQMLKAKQQQHEQELYELKIRTEREALETKLQMEENRQRVAQAHVELQESLAATQKETLEGLQEATTKMMSQQAEAARYTADTARHIKEMTEMAHGQLTTLKHPSILSASSEKEELSSHTKQSTENAHVESNLSTKPQLALNSFSHSDHSDSVSFRRPGPSGAEMYHIQRAPNKSPEHKEWIKKEAAEGGRRQRPSKDDMDGEEGSTSIEDEVLTAANDSLYSDSIPSAVEQKGDSTSVATELSLKFDESITEDEIEERSFRSLLPSEAHRRGTLDKKSRHPTESEEDLASPNSPSVSGVHNIFKSQDVNKAFSGGQDSFSQFTMEMVRQYMRDEEVRLQHQSSLLRLRQKALKEKTRTELAWLEHQKKKLRDKGEDDKMPPIRKKQRGLLMKLQQEQAEIKRLQEANKAARKERQLLLKQQEEIERMRSCTLKLKERLKCADTEAPSGTSALEVVSSNLRTTDPKVRSPSPTLSISGSETSSIMQKLKKMRSQTDEKFLTKREQQLMQRRRHAEELLQWKQRLDQEEAEVRRIEKEALAAWDGQTSQNKGDYKSESEKDLSPSVGQRKKDYTSEGNVSSAAESSIHTDVGVQQDESSELAKPTSVSEMASIQSSPANYTDEFTSLSPSPSRQSDQTSTIKGRVSVSACPSDGSSKTRTQNCTSLIPNHEEKTDSPITKQTEPISDQSDIESRIRALKEELQKRKVTAYQLKKEQKKRTKERLKAKEANLRKQLETYNDIIEKTKAELKTVSDSAPDSKSPITDLVSCSECPSDKIPPQSSDSRKTFESEKITPEALFDKDVTALPDESRPTSLPTVFSDKGPPTVAPTPIQDSPECQTSGLKDCQSVDALIWPPKEIPAQTNESGDEKIISEHGSEIQEELESDTSQKSEDQSSECLLKLDKDNKMDTAAEPISHHSLLVNSVLDKQIDTRQTSKAEEAVKSPQSLLGKSVTADITTHPSASPLSIVHSSSEKETFLKDNEASPLLSVAYHDDFESSVDSSPREGSPNSKPVAENSISHSEKVGLQKNVPTWITMRDSQDEDVEEEIAEELSGCSGASDGSHQYKIIVDVHDQAGASGRDSKDSPTPTSPKISSVPVTDEMPGFNIGDRVVVSGVQPGTLRFKGPTSFANGFWAGVELDKSEGSNNGTYDGVLYFTCAERHGIFAPPDKITRLTDKFEMYTDTTEDDDSFCDDVSDDERDKKKNKETKSKQNKLAENELTSLKDVRPGNNKVIDELVHMDKANYKSQLQEQSKHPITNGKSIWDFEDVPTPQLIADTEKMGVSTQSQTEVTNLVKRADIDLNHQFVVSDVSHDIKNDDGLKNKLSSFADKLLTDFVKDTVQQYTEIKKSKVKRITAANQMNGNAFEEEDWISSVDQKDGLPFFLTQEKEELSSPELCNRPQSPVLGASGQEELAKRLAELELSRELLDELGDDHDWFEEDFGLSSRREQQRQKQREEEERAKLGGGKTSSTAAISLLSGEQQVKTPPRPELPLPLPPKLPEQPAMVVPHSATQVEKMVHAATLEIWETCGLGKDGSLTISQLQRPKPSHKYIGEEPHWEDQEAVCIYSYRKAVFDLTWEILQDMYAEDPSANQPQWLKPQRVMSSSFQRVRTPGSIARIQECITAEVLKLYGLTKDQSQKTDWQKMLKFGRKKRDRVDHILVQELHEEEAQWVNYDEDELFVKIQLADSIFDALLKDTANVLTQIYDKRDSFS